MNIECHVGWWEKRVFFKEYIEGDRGIRAYLWLTGFFLSCLGYATRLKSDTGKILYVNKKSLHKWKENNKGFCDAQNVSNEEFISKACQQSLELRVKGIRYQGSFLDACEKLKSAAVRFSDQRKYQNVCTLIDWLKSNFKPQSAEDIDTSLYEVGQAADRLLQQSRFFFNEELHAIKAIVQAKRSNYTVPATASNLIANVSKNVQMELLLSRLDGVARQMAVEGYACFQENALIKFLEQKISEIATTPLQEETEDNAKFKALMGQVEALIKDNYFSEALKMLDSFDPSHRELIDNRKNFIQKLIGFRKEHEACFANPNQEDEITPAIEQALKDLKETGQEDSNQYRFIYKRLKELQNEAEFVKGLKSLDALACQNAFIDNSPRLQHLIKELKALFDINMYPKSEAQAEKNKAFEFGKQFLINKLFDELKRLKSFALADQALKQHQYAIFDEQVDTALTLVENEVLEATQEWVDTFMMTFNSLLNKSPDQAIQLLSICTKFVSRRPSFFELRLKLAQGLKKYLQVNLDEEFNNLNTQIYTFNAKAREQLLENSEQMKLLAGYAKIFPAYKFADLKPFCNAEALEFLNQEKQFSNTEGQTVLHLIKKIIVKNLLVNSESIFQSALSEKLADANINADLIIKLTAAHNSLVDAYNQILKTSLCSEQERLLNKINGLKVKIADLEKKKTKGSSSSPGPSSRRIV